MDSKKSPKKQSNQGQSREDRLKAALKQNMAKRKAQMRARASKDENEGGNGE